MRFSEETVYVVGVILSLMVSVAVSVPLGKYELRGYWFQKRKNSANDLITVIVFVLLIGGWLFYMVRNFYHYTTVLWILGVGTVLECVFLYSYLKPLNSRFFEERLYSTPEEEVAKQHGKLRNIPMVVVLMSTLVLNVCWSMGGIAFASWIMPDVVEIQDGPRRSGYEYKVSDYYTLPFERGMKPGGSYIDNLSKDTVYRLVVDYGFVGEERYNFYTVQDKYPPHSLSRMPGRAMHAMDTIAPIMPPSYGRMGRYRTQRVYLTDNEHLWDFKFVNMKKFGLERNKWVDSIRENRNHLIRENYEEYRTYKAIDPFPYLRLRPDSLIRKNNIRYEER